MKITKVSYGRTIEVGGPFGRHPVEKVWFGWDVEVDPDLESEQEATSRLRGMADEREKEERTLYHQRLHEAALERALLKDPIRRSFYEQNLVNEHEREQLPVFNALSFKGPEPWIAPQRCRVTLTEGWDLFVNGVQVNTGPHEEVVQTGDVIEPKPVKP